MQLSVIIPTYNEAENIGRLVRRLLEASSAYQVEVLVIDAASTDQTASIARKEGAQVFEAEQKGRAQQLIQGASLAIGEVLYFVHGDTLPPKGYVSAIFDAISGGYPMGCFRFKFDSDKKALRFNSFMTRFGILIARGGDQSLYITRPQYDALGGFRADYQIMEDFEIIVRARKQQIPFKVIQEDILVSARKYDHNSWLRVQIANLTVFTMFRLGYSQKHLVETYKKLLVCA